MIKLASNENPFGPSPLAEAAVRAASSEINLYPDTDATELRSALASQHNLPLEQIFITDGSTPMLDILARVFLNHGLNCISSDRSFFVYALVSRTTGGQYVAVPMKNDAYDLGAIAAAINHNTRLIILANPNNPTGTMFDADETEAFLRRVPDNVLVVLDEAYCDFGDYFAAQRGVTYSRSFEYVRAGRPNLIVLRTFSKAHGLAGVRVGYACGHPELLRHLSHVRTPFSISVLAEAAALAALKDKKHIRITLENNAAGADRLMDFFRATGVRAVPTSANFVYFETEENADILARQMQAEGIIIRSLVPWGISNGLRVTIGTPEQNERFVEAFKKTTAQIVAPSGR
jgi:histidinol-phosphate aminotransferase